MAGVYQKTQEQSRPPLATPSPQMKSGPMGKTAQPVSRGGGYPILATPAPSHGNGSAVAVVVGMVLIVLICPGLFFLPCIFFGPRLVARAGVHKFAGWQLCGLGKGSTLNPK